MRKGIVITSSGILISILFCLSACHYQTSLDDKSIATDSLSIANGQNIFIQNCSSCHNFRQDGIGPQLRGLTDSVSVEWIKNFIKDPQEIIESGDERALKLFNKYKVVMPSFPLMEDAEVNAIIAYLHTYKKHHQMLENEVGKELKNPIPDSIKLSNLVVGLQLVAHIPASSNNGKLPLTRITKLDFELNSGNSFILDQRGKLYKLLTKKPVVYMDMAKLKPKFIDEPGLGTGFGSFAFHPEFSKNGLLYTTHTETNGSGKADFVYTDSIKVTLQWVLTEWKTEHPEAVSFSGKSREIFRINMVSILHGVQEITFNPLAKAGDKDYGMLYIGIGDGGSVEEGYPFLVHSKDKVWGTVFRINPKGRNSPNGQYGIPGDNPFAKNQNSKTVREIYAYGFRNPHRITWSKAGQMLVCNIGQGNIESVNMVKPGHDYGWPIREGTFVLNPYEDLNKVYSLPGDDSIYNITYPIAQYDHDEGKAICGGFEYMGEVIPKLKGKYIFGDITEGILFYINMADVKDGKQALIKKWRVSIYGEQKTLKELCGSNRVDLHFGKDSQGELYILTKADGKVYKLVSANTL